MDLSIFTIPASAHGSLTIGIVLMVFALLAFTTWAPDVILMLSAALLVLLQVITPAEALAGLANEGMVTIAVLCVVGAGVQETGGIDWIATKVLGRPKTSRGALVRMLLPTTTLSAFINNTPLVAMLVPVLGDWCKKLNISPSKIMLPLSYASILGGTCTLIGTSTNLVVSGQLFKANGHQLGMFDIAWVGVPVAIVGCLFIVAVAPWMLPDRKPALSQLDDPREYTIEMLVPPDSPLANKTIEEAGLRHLPGVYLAEIDRDGVVVGAVSPDERLRPGDRLVFVGVVESVVDLQRMRGLTPANDQVFKLSSPRATRCLIEAVVSNTFPLLGETIRESRFRSVYNSVILAVARNGERLRQKIGDIVLQPGDTLLLEGQPSFVEEQKNRRDFFLVSRLGDASPPQHDRAYYALAIFTVMIALASFELMSMFKASLMAAILMIATRCTSVSSARRAIDLPTLLAIAASFALGLALDKTGAAKGVADTFQTLSGGHPWGALAMIYLITLVATELVTNNAAAALMLPFALTTAKSLDVNYMPFVIVVMIAASNGFATPLGYQTHLMVYGPGGYRFSDFVRIGVPLDLVVFAVTVAITPYFFPF
ncbi:MAG: SLC13 family permease [Planctomycetaceae bacterium]|nr:SLC13 family permease [Planctomycetaceae bacterium]